MQSNSREVRTYSVQSVSSQRQVFPSLVTLVSRLNLYISSEAMDFKGKEGAAADKLFEEALGLERAGCCAVVLEKVPASVAARVAQSLQIPVIGIGAGSGVDGQVLVSQDMLGMERPLHAEVPPSLRCTW